MNTLSGAQGKCFMKIIVDHKSDRVIGMHMIGAASAEIMQACPPCSSPAACSSLRLRNMERAAGRAR